MCVEPQTTAYIHRCFEHDIGKMIITHNHKLTACIQGLSECSIQGWPSAAPGATGGPCNVVSGP